VELMLGLALATLRTRRGSFIGAFVAMFCAAAFVAACGMLLQTGLSGVVPPQRYAGAPLLVAADQNLHFTKEDKDKTKTKSKPATDTVRLPASVVARVRVLPGVAAAVPEVTFPATVLGGPAAGASWGHGWGSARLTPFTLQSGHPPTGANDVILDADSGARVGDTVTIQTPESAAKYTVVGVTAQALPGQRAVFFADATAERLAGDRLSAIGVWPAAGTDQAALTRALTGIGAGITVYTGDDRGVVEFRDASRAQVALISLSAVLGGTALLVSILVVVGTFALSIEQRYREIALLRAVGATPRQIRRMLSRESLAVGIVAAGLGSLAGIPLAGWLHGRFVAYGAIPERLRLVTGALPPLAAVLATIGAAWIAARVAARHATRVRPTAALAESATSSRRLAAGTGILGAVVVAAGTGALILLPSLHTEPAAMPVTMLTVVAWATGLALLGPLVARVAAGALAGPLRLLSRTGGYLAGENLVANTRRLASVVAPTTLAVGMAVTVLCVETTLGGAAGRQATQGVVAAYALRGAGAGIPADVVDGVSATPGVTAVTQVLRGTVWIDKNRYPAQGVTPDGLRSTLDLGVVDGDIGTLGQQEVALSTTTAAGLGKHVGDTLALRLGDGTPVSLRIVATYSRGLGFGALTLPYALLAGHVDVPLAAAVLVAAPASTGPALRALAGRYPGVQLLDGTAFGAARVSTNDAAVRYIALGLVVAFAAIAVVNALAMTTVDRRREFALLRLVGTTRRQVMRMLRFETLAAVLTALVLGGAVGGATLAAFAWGMTGSAVPSVSLPACAVIAGGVALLAYLGTAAPARFALRRPR
jgi:putative ABC transport system permease protein